jgi:hypothetical protein
MAKTKKTRFLLVGSSKLFGVQVVPDLGQAEGHPVQGGDVLAQREGQPRLYHIPHLDSGLLLLTFFRNSRACGDPDYFEAFLLER